MSDCSRIDPLVTPFVDGALHEADRALVEGHVRACPACRSRVDAERSVHDLVGAHRAGLCGLAAPAALRERCRQAPASAAVPAGPAAVSTWRARAVPLALAATLVVALAGVVVYRFTAAPISLMAAELTTDHVKCFMLHGHPERPPTASEVEEVLEQMFAWDATLPDAPERAGLELLGARPCFYAEGRVAHIMYRYEGRPVSVFMLPNRERAADLFEVVGGHRALAWTTAGRTFMLVAHEPPAEMERIARFVRAGLR